MIPSCVVDTDDNGDIIKITIFHVAPRFTIKEQKHESDF